RTVAEERLTAFLGCLTIQKNPERVNRGVATREPGGPRPDREDQPMGTAYRADQVGSFLRPPELLEARRAGQPVERRRALEDRHIRRVLAKQQELGFDVFTDGELRRTNFMSDFTDAVEGFDFGDAVARSWQAGGPAAAPVSSVAG